MIVRHAAKRSGLTAALLLTTAIVAPAFAATTPAVAPVAVPTVGLTQQDAVALPGADSTSLYDYPGGSYYPQGVNGAQGHGAQSISLYLRYSQALSASSGLSSSLILSGNNSLSAYSAYIGAALAPMSPLSLSLSQAGSLSQIDGGPVILTAPALIDLPTKQTVGMSVQAQAGFAIGCQNGFVGVAATGGNGGGAGGPPGGAGGNGGGNGGGGGGSGIQQLFLMLNAGYGPTAAAALSTTTPSNTAIRTSVALPVACGEARPVQLATYNANQSPTADSVVLAPNHALSGTSALVSGNFGLFAANNLSFNSTAPLSSTLPNYAFLSSGIGAANTVHGGAIALTGVAPLSAYSAGANGSIPAGTLNTPGEMLLNPKAPVEQLSFSLTNARTATAWDNSSAGSANSTAIFDHLSTASTGQFWLNATSTAISGVTYADVFIPTPGSTFGQPKPFTLTGAGSLSASVDLAVPSLLNVNRYFTGPDAGVLALTFSEPLSPFFGSMSNAALGLGQGLSSGNTSLNGNGNVSVGLLANSAALASTINAALSSGKLMDPSTIPGAVIPNVAIKTASGTLFSDAINGAFTIGNGGWGVLGSQASNVASADKGTKNALKALRTDNVVVFDIGMDGQQNIGPANNANYLNGYSLSSVGGDPAYSLLLTDPSTNPVQITSGMQQLPYLPMFSTNSMSAQFLGAMPVTNSQGLISDIYLTANKVLSSSVAGSDPTGVQLASDFTITVNTSNGSPSIVPATAKILANGKTVDLQLPTPLPTNIINGDYAGSVTYSDTGSNAGNVFLYDPSATAGAGPVRLSAVDPNYCNGASASYSTMMNCGMNRLPDGDTVSLSHPGNATGSANGLFTQEILGQVQKRMGANSASPGTIVGVPGVSVRADLVYIDKGRTLTGAATATVPVINDAIKTTANSISLNISPLCTNFNGNNNSSSNSASAWGTGQAHYNNDSSQPNGIQGCGGLLAALDAEAAAGVSSVPAYLYVGTIGSGWNANAVNSYLSTIPNETSCPGNTRNTADYCQANEMTVYPVAIATTASVSSGGNGGPGSLGGFAISGTGGSTAGGASANSAGISGSIFLQNTQPYLNDIMSTQAVTDTNGNYRLNVGTSTMPPAPANVLISVMDNGFSNNGNSNGYQLATYLDPSLNNYLPFKPDIGTTKGLTLTPTTTLSGNGGNGTTVQNIRLDLLGQVNLPHGSGGGNGSNYNGASTYWQLVGLPGNIARAASTTTFQVPLLFTSVDPMSGTPGSLWYNNSFDVGNGDFAYNAAPDNEAFALVGGSAFVDFSLDGGLTTVPTIGANWKSGLAIAFNNSGNSGKGGPSPSSPNNGAAPGLGNGQNVPGPTLYYPLTDLNGTTTVAPNVAQPLALAAGWSLVTYQGTLPGNPATFGTGTNSTTIGPNFGQTIPGTGTTPASMIIAADDFSPAQTWLKNNTVSDINGTSPTVANSLTVLNPGQAYFIYLPSATTTNFTFQ